MAKGSRIGNALSFGNKSDNCCLKRCTMMRINEIIDS